MAFLQQRRTFKREVCGGRPGIVVYVNMHACRPDKRGDQPVDQGLREPIFNAAKANIIYVVLIVKLPGDITVPLPNP